MTLSAGARDHVGGVEPAAEPHLQQQQVRAMVPEGMERRGRGDLEEGDRRAVVDGLAMGQARAQRLLRDRPAVEPDPFGEADQVRRDVAVHPIARGNQHRFEIGDDAALAVGPGNVDDRRRGALRVAERVEQPGHAPEREVDGLGMEREQAVEDRVARARRRRFGRLVHATGSARPGAAHARRGSQPESAAAGSSVPSPVSGAFPCRAMTSAAGVLFRSRESSVDSVSRSLRRCTTMSTIP